MRAGGFKHITVPVNGSSTSQCGVRRALDLATDDTLVTFCSVWSPASAFASNDALLDAEPIIAELEANARGFCAEAERAAVTRGVVADSVIREGRPAETIHDCVRENGSDAIVIGTHGRTGIARAALGSVAEELIHTSQVPVVVVHEDDAVRSGPIGVAIDQSPAAATALGTAIQLARASSSELLLIHVFGNADLRQTTPPVRSDYEGWKAAAQRDAAAMMEQAAVRVQQAGISFETLMIDGDPAEVLLQTIDARKCSSVVVGTHGRSNLGRLFLGSVSAALVERARVPVIVAK